MMFHKLGLVNKNQKGFTFIEVMMVLAVSGIVMSGVSMTFYQLVIGSGRANNHMIAVKQVQDAGYFVSQDTLAAQSVVYDDPTTPGVTEFLTLRWTDWTDTPNTVRYTLEDAALWCDNGTHQFQVARFIDFDPENFDFDPENPEKTSRNFADTNGDGIEDTLIFRVTAVVGSGSQQQSETREYRIVPRPL